MDPGGPGISRVRRGRGFSYHEHDGELITDAATLERIRGLAIPPAWADVWICPDPRGHIQATGRDDADRKQYLYHDEWRARQDQIKFDEMLDFARKLPKLRQRIESGLSERGLVFERVCACATALLDMGLFRIGSERYETENETYGLTTLKRRHLSFERGVAIFEYPSKSGKVSLHRISDPSVRPTLKSLARRGSGGDGLLCFREGREWQDLRSDHVNAWIKETVGQGFSAKDLRTWNATVLAATALAARDPKEATSRSARERIAREVVAQVAEYLNNTPAVCRASYIDPRVFDCFDSGETIRRAMSQIESGSDPGGFPEREAIERAVIRLLG